MNGIFDLSGTTRDCHGRQHRARPGNVNRARGSRSEPRLVDHVESTETDRAIQAMGRKTLPLVADLSNLSSITMIHGADASRVSGRSTSS